MEINKTAIDWLVAEISIPELGEVPHWIKEKVEQAKRMESAEQVRIQIRENRSVLEMLEVHSTDSSRMRVRFRIEALEQQLGELEA